MNYTESMAQTRSIKPKRPQTKPRGLHTFHEALLAWYNTHGRHNLPWRQTDDPYPIWISEVMLQQTQVATVRERFYAPFLKQFPTIEVLAAAPESAVMKAWEGLGYYSRARNLHKAAKALAAQAKTLRKNKAALPATASELLALSGIGRNTAHAILAFAYHQPVAILEANVKRVVARIFACTHPTDEQLWAHAESLLNPTHPFDHNQAMMDLGSMVCTPKTPHCTACPAATLCAGKHAPLNYPAPKAKKSVPTRHVAITVREDKNGKLYLEQRGAKLLGGLWGFPQSAHDVPPTTHHSLGKVTHIYSHFKLVAHVEHCITAPQKSERGWFNPAEIATLALSKLDHKILALVEKRHSAEKKPSKARAARTKR